VCGRGVSTGDLICFDLKDTSLNEEIARAKYTAKQKAIGNRTFDKFKNRTSFERFMNLFTGDLAKNLFRKLVEDKFGINLIDYDQIRKDNFEKYDLFDLKYETENCEIEIEVKSSVEKYSRDKDNLIEKRRIIVYDEKGIKDIIVQVLFIPKDKQCLNFAKDYGNIDSGENPVTLEEFKKKHSINDEDDFVDKFRNCMEACIMGFITEEYVREVNEKMPFQREGESPRDYLNIYIKDSFPIQCLVEKIKKICEEKKKKK